MQVLVLVIAAGKLLLDYSLDPVLVHAEMWATGWNARTGSVDLLQGIKNSLFVAGSLVWRCDQEFCFQPGP